MHWPVAISLLSALAVPAHAQLNFPRLLSIVRESPANLGLDGTMTYRFTAEAGTVPLASVAVVTYSTDIQVHVLRATSGSANTVSASIDATWQNGAHALNSVILTDVWGRSVTYLSNADIQPSSPAFYAGPTKHSFDFSAHGFTVGGVGAPSLPSQITELIMLSSGTLNPGSTARVRYTIAPGYTPMSRLILSFRNATASLVHTVTTDLTAASGEIAVPITAEMVNGRYRFSSVALTSSTGGGVTYGDPAGQIVIQSIGGLSVSVALPYLIATSQLEFTVAGAGTTAAAPALTTWMREGGAEISPGSAVKFTYATATPTSYPVRTVALTITGPYGGVRGFTSETASGTFTVPVADDWIAGSYTARVTVTDAAGRATTYATGGAITVSTGVQRPTGAESFSNAMFDFVVNGRPVGPYFALQPAAETRVGKGLTVTLTARAVGLTATSTLSWFQGEPGDTSKPITAGVRAVTATTSELTVGITAPATYWVRAINGGVTIASTAARVFIIEEPTIAEQPTGQVVPLGGTATFSVTAAGEGPFAYEWRTGFLAPAGLVLNQRTLQIEASDIRFAGTVTCIVTNPGGSVASQSASLTILGSDTPLHFVEEQGDATFTLGDSAGELRMSFAGNPPFSYRWQKDGRDLAPWNSYGMTASYRESVRFSFINVADQQEGRYRLIVTNGFETIYSREVQVRFTRVPVVFTSGPAAVTAFIGSGLQLLGSAVGQTPLQFQWRKDGVAIPGATAWSYSRFIAGNADAGSYDFVVTNPAGSATSRPTVVTVFPFPASVPPGIAEGPAQGSQQKARAGETVTFTVVPTGDNRRCVWYHDSRVVQDGAAASLTLRTVGSSDSGSYRVLVGSPTGSATVRDFRFTVTPAQDRLVVMRPPAGTTFKRGDTAQLNVAVDGKAAIRYQWRRNGVPIPTIGDFAYGIDGTTLYLPNFDGTKVGAYDVVATNDLGSVISTSATLSLPPPGPEGRLMNVSVRANAGGAYGPLVVGFVVGGGTPEDMPLLVRAAGRALEPFGITDALPNPTALLHAGSAPRFFNDDWSGFAPVAATAARVGAFPFPTVGSRDAALVPALPAGPYTVHISGSDTSGGLALAEIYDATPASEINAQRPRLLNLSVQTRIDGAAPVIVGFALGGMQSRRILARAVGPSLASFGVQGAHADPQLSLYREQTRLAENNDWAGGAELRTAFEAVGAFALASGASKDAALVASLTPGTYTVQVSGVGTGAGLVLVEVYELP